MSNLEIAQTTKTPYVLFKTNGDLYIKGLSYNEDSHKVYKPIKEWVINYANNLPENTKITLTLDLDYVNTSSLSCILDVVHIVDSYRKTNDVEFCWYYEDEENLELGEDLERVLKSRFIFIDSSEVKKNNNSSN